MNEPFRLFVVDANEEVAILMRFHLERAGHEVTVCRTAADAQIVLGQSPYHLVLLDDHLPDMHGLKLLQTLAAEGFHAPVLIMTAHGDEKVATQALLAGAIDFLVKDNALAFLAELPQRVEEAVTRHRLQQSNQRQLLHAQKMQSVGTLAGGVAHEFNNLLAGIQGYAALALREPGTSAELTQFLQFIVELSDRAANLTRQLLAFARKPVLTRHPTNLASLLSATADLVRSSMRIDVNVEVPDAAPHPHPPGDGGGGERGDEGEGEPLRALADANQLQQVLINLARNARDAQTRPEPILFLLQQVLLNDTLPAFPEPVPPGDYAMLEVRDGGKGMTPEVLEHAFDPFFTTKDVGQGPGLGLPVAFGIMHGHQGHLTLDSRVDGGTSVRLFLPRLKEAPPPSPLPPTPDGRGALKPEQTAGRPILVVDDEPAVLDVVRRFLEIAGYRVRCLTTGTEALEVLSNENPFELLVLDLMIPREDGSATFQQVRRRWPQLPILLCTGLLQTDSAAPSFQGEQVHLLRKPFRMNELWLAVNQALTAVPSL